MSRRAEQMRHLAELLSQQEHSRLVTARWVGDPTDPERGYWTMSWVDGPTWDTMCPWAEKIVATTPRLTGLDPTTIWGQRVDSPLAWAVLLVREVVPRTWRTPRIWPNAQALLDHATDLIGDLDWLDDVSDPGEKVAAAGLVATSRGDRLRMARLALAEWRQLPKAVDKWDREHRLTGRCHQCGALFLVKPGPEPRWCTPRCRLRHWRATHPTTPVLTEPGNEPTCDACGQPIPDTGRRGRPARFCSPGCRQFAHHHRDSDPTRRSVAYARRRANPPEVVVPPPAAGAAEPVAVWAAAPKPRPARPRTPLAADLADCLGGCRTVHQLHLEVEDIDPPIWRRLQVPSGMPLVRLSDVLCTALDWSGEHLHAFGGLGGGDGHYTNPAEFQLTIADLLQDVDWNTTYTYDFGDWWHVTVTVEKILTRPSTTTFYPRCTAGRRNGPAEDCGGVPGYEQLLKALRARKGWRYQQAREQHPGWKPETFDLAEVNRDLERWYRDTHRED